MLTLEQINAELEAKSLDYMNPETPSGPNPDVVDHASKCDVMVLIGPSGSGKTTLKAKLCEAVSAVDGNVRLHETQSVTTRDPRKSELTKGVPDPFMRRFDMHTQRGQDEVMDGFDGGLYVQTSFHFLALYATLAPAYVQSTPDKRVVNLTDFTAAYFEQALEQKRFRHLQGVLLAATNPEQWAVMRGQRKDDESPHAMVMRVDEADSSMGSCLTLRKRLGRAILVVAHDFSDDCHPPTNLPATTEKLFAVVTCPNAYDDSAAISDASRQHTFIKGIRLGMRLGLGFGPVTETSPAMT